VASAAPTPTRTRELALWRGTARAQAGDIAGMRSNLDRAVEVATAQGSPAARCEALTRLAVEAARLGGRTASQELLDIAEGAAQEAKALGAILPGHAQWVPECDAALATVLLARGNIEAAVASAAAAIEALAASHHEDVYPDVIIPAGEVLLEHGPPEAQSFPRG